MIAKIEIRDKKIERVSYLPVYIPDDFKPYVVKPQDPLFKTINDYMIMINEMVGIETKYTVDGDEIVIG
jgi:hypothetical protein